MPETPLQRPPAAPKGSRLSTVAALMMLMFGAGFLLILPGRIGFALVFGGIIGPLRLRRRIRPRMTGQREDDRILYLALTYIPVSVAGFAVCGFFLSFAYFDVIYVLTAYVTGLYILTTSTARQPARRNQAVRRELSGARSSQESTVRRRFGHAWRSPVA